MSARSSLAARFAAPLAALLVLGALAAAGCACPGRELVVRGAGGDEAARFCAEVAETEAARRQGLRGRAPLDPDEGLYLPFPVEAQVCIVNDGVGFAIDALYADADGGVVAIERAIAAGDATARCHDGVQHVLEVSAGALAEASVGDRLEGVDAPAFGP